MAQSSESAKQLQRMLRDFGFFSTFCAVSTVAAYPPSAKALILEYSPATWNMAERAVAQWRASHGKAPVLLFAAESSEESAIRAIRLGVCEYVRFPSGFARLHESLCALVPEFGDDPPDLLLVGTSYAMRVAREQIRRVAQADSNILITGETGTGKEIAARTIHEQSPRRDKPFICVNCAAIPDSLLESELFGYEKGAFTGANAAAEGKMRLAHSGTLFLDEIGEMSPYAQAKILRAIDTHEVWPLGARRSVRVDLHIVAATNREIDPASHGTGFRPDLYFRLSTTRICLPPLRDRISDIPALLNHFMAQFNRRFEIRPQGFSPEAIEALLHYNWPGNVRELRNVVESAYVNLSSHWVELADLPPRFKQAADRRPSGERERLIEALRQTNWNISSAANRLSWSRMTIYRKMAKYNVSKEAERGLANAASVSRAS